MKERLPVAVAGATGTVGQRFIAILENHPWFNVTSVAASPKSAGKKYEEAVKDRWHLKSPIPETTKDLIISDVSDVQKFVEQGIRVVFSAVEMSSDEIARVEELYAHHGLAVVSNTSAHRWTRDVPMILPEVNPDHAKLIDIQRRNRGWDTGLIAVKPNCSIQSFVPAVYPLMDLDPRRIIVTTMQAVSGAGKTLTEWPEMRENVNPYIGGEDEKSMREPLKILGKLSDSEIVLNSTLNISARCHRVGVEDGHMADVLVEFGVKTTRDEILERWSQWETETQRLNLPSAPEPFLIYIDDPVRPQPILDKDAGNGMAVTLGNLRAEDIFAQGYGFRFNGLSHNTIRGAAGGSVLLAELLYASGYLDLA